MSTPTVPIADGVTAVRDDRSIADRWFLVEMEFAFNASRGGEWRRNESVSMFSSPAEAAAAYEAGTVEW